MSLYGKLVFYISEANLNKDVNMVLDRNPNYMIECHGQKKTSQTCYQGGKQPTWNEKHEIILNSVEGQCKVTIKSDSDFIAQVTLDVS